MSRLQRTQYGCYGKQKKTEFQGQVTLQVRERPVIVGKPRSQQKIRREGQRGDEELEIVPDFHLIIREAREKSAMTQEELALKLMEKKHALILGNTLSNFLCQSPTCP